MCASFRPTLAFKTFEKVSPIAAPISVVNSLKRRLHKLQNRLTVRRNHECGCVRGIRLEELFWLFSGIVKPFTVMERDDAVSDAVDDHDRHGCYARNAIYAFVVVGDGPAQGVLDGPG